MEWVKADFMNLQQLLPPFRITCHFGFSRYISFVMHPNTYLCLDTLHYVSRKAKTTSNLGRRSSKQACRSVFCFHSTPSSWWSSWVGGSRADRDDLTCRAITLSHRTQVHSCWMQQKFAVWIDIRGATVKLWISHTDHQLCFRMCWNEWAICIHEGCMHIL
jgi:hypothetical protein